MKRLISLLLIILFSVTVVNAESKSVLVKYQEKSNVTKYTSTIKNGSTSLIVDGKTINIQVDSSADGEEILIIKTEGDAYDYISSINGEGNYYYVSILGEEEFDITSLIKSVSIDDGVINVFSSDGNVLAKDITSYNVSSSSFYLTVSNKNKEPRIYESINLVIEGKGRVIIDSKIYDKSQTVSLKKDSIAIFMSDSNYIFNKLLIDEVDNTNMVINNKITLSSNNMKTIKVVFETKPNSYSDKTITVDGYIRRNKMPLQNVKLILHSTEYTTTTDSNGYYEFEDVDIGSHELLVLSESGVALGYVCFDIEKSEFTSLYKENNKQVVNIGNDFYIVNIDMNLINDYDISFDNVHSITYTEEETKTTNYYFLIILPIIIFISMVIFIKKYK